MAAEVEKRGVGEVKNQNKELGLEVVLEQRMGFVGRCLLSKKGG